MAGLLRECLVLAPPAVFLALAILNQFAQTAPTSSERKDQRELQEIAGKLIEACSQVGGSCLEQTTWLRRNYAVRSELQAEAAEDVDPNEVGLYRTKHTLVSGPDTQIYRTCLTQPVGLYWTSRPFWKSGRFRKSVLSGNRTFSLPDQTPLKKKSKFRKK